MISSYQCQGDTPASFWDTDVAKTQKPSYYRILNTKYCVSVMLLSIHISWIYTCLLVILQLGLSWPHLSKHEIVLNILKSSLHGRDLNDQKHTLHFSCSFPLTFYCCTVDCIRKGWCVMRADQIDEGHVADGFLFEETLASQPHCVSAEPELTESLC